MQIATMVAQVRFCLLSLIEIVTLTSLGNVGETCGGDGISGGLAMITLFADSTRFDGNGTEPVGPVVNPGILGFISVGCWTDAGNPRTLSVGENPTTQTIASCVQACQGYQYAGMEYGGECYCGNR